MAMGTSLAVAFLMLAGKLWAYQITGSVAILSDAAESVVHLFATGLAALSLWYSSVPADKNHPYGHGKIAYFSAGFEGAFILIAALFVIFMGAQNLLTGPELTDLGTGLIITATLAGVNLALGIFLVTVGKARNAIILVANGKHVLTDMWTSVGVVAGVAAVKLTGIEWLDPVVAIIVGLNILFTAVLLMVRSFRGLLDEADPEHTRVLLKHLEDAVAQGTLSGFHQLRHRNSNDTMWIEVHMLLPDEMTNAEAHRRVTDIEASLQTLFPQYSVHVTSHVEPASHELAHPEGHAGVGDPYGDESTPPT